eukprot:81641-Chlamydomonas_euryale.AAC.21
MSVEPAMASGVRAARAGRCAEQRSVLSCMRPCHPFPEMTGHHAKHAVTICISALQLQMCSQPLGFMQQEQEQRPGTEGSVVLPLPPNATYQNEKPVNVNVSEWVPPGPTISMLSMQQMRDMPFDELMGRVRQPQLQMPGGIMAALTGPGLQAAITDGKSK